MTETEPSLFANIYRSWKFGEQKEAGIGIKTYLEPPDFLTELSDSPRPQQINIDRRFESRFEIQGSRRVENNLYMFDESESVRGGETKIFFANVARHGDQFFEGLFALFLNQPLKYLKKKKITKKIEKTRPICTKREFWKKKKKIWDEGKKLGVLKIEEKNDGQEIENLTRQKFAQRLPMWMINLKI